MKAYRSKRTHAQTGKSCGFTLIELVIVVAILGILAAIAYPSYQKQIMDSRRSDCAGELELLANAMERRFTLTGSYVGGLPPGFVNCPVDGGLPIYAFAVVTPTPTSFTASAAPIAGGPQTQDDCATLTLTQIGTKGMLGAAAGLTVQDCW